MRVAVVDPADVDALIRWNAVLRSAFVDGRDGVSWSTDAAVVAQFANPKAGRRRFALIATGDDGRPLGAADAAQLGDDPVELGIAVLAEHRRRGIGTQLWAAARELFSDGRIAQAEAYSDAGVAFAASVGLSVAHREHRMLRPADLPVPAVAAVAGVVVRTWTGAVPDDLVEDWARLNARMGEEVPLGDLTRTAVAHDVQRVRENEQRMADQGWLMLRSMAVADGVGIGYTLMFITAAGADVIVQDDTFVEVSHRGRGVARMLKTANLRALAEVPAAASARWVQTWTSVTNEPMLALNRAMGFREADLLYELEGPLSITNA